MAFIEVCSGVYQVGGEGLSHSDDCCVYLIVNKTGSILIDAGARPNAQRIYDNIISTGTDPEIVKNIVATHGHIDHIGGLNWLKHRLLATVTAHELELPAIVEGDPRLTAASYYGITYQPVTVEQVIHGSRHELCHIVCLSTPGHTPGSISVYTEIDDKRVLFGQDIHGPFSSDWGSDLKQWRQSMQLLLDLEADLLCEGHYGVIAGRQEIKDFICGFLRRF